MDLWVEYIYLFFSSVFVFNVLVVVQVFYELAERVIYAKYKML